MNYILCKFLLYNCVVNYFGSLLVKQSSVGHIAIALSIHMPVRQSFPLKLFQIITLKIMTQKSNFVHLKTTISRIAVHKKKIILEEYSTSSDHLIYKV